jgi:signal transduction histidine kinase
MPVDLADAIQEVVALVRSRIRAAGATLRVESNPDVPAAHGDRVQLQQVLMNLLTNALEALRDVPHGARELSIHIRRSEGDRVLCEVRDTGPGVPPVSRDRIFEPFYTTKPEGMGIGLSIARNIVESHGGKLRVRDDEGARGATFYFDLPGRPEPPSSG